LMVRQIKICAAIGWNGFCRTSSLLFRATRLAVRANYCHRPSADSVRTCSRQFRVLHETVLRPSQIRTSRAASSARPSGSKLRGVLGICRPTPNGCIAARSGSSPRAKATNPNVYFRRRFPGRDTALRSADLPFHSRQVPRRLESKHLPLSEMLSRPKVR
jgi:hypothetical protein